MLRRVVFSAIGFFLFCGLGAVPAVAVTWWSGPVGNSACSMVGGLITGGPFPNRSVTILTCPADNTSVQGLAAYRLESSVKRVSVPVSRQARRAVGPNPGAAKESVSDMELEDSFAGDFGSGHYRLGLAAGDGEQQYGAWADMTFTDTVGDDALLRFDSDLYTMLIGMDYRFNERTAAGVALSYETTDENTYYNSGELESRGVSVVPYLAMSLNDMFSMDFLAGYTVINIDQSQSIKISSLDASRIFAQANATAFYSHGNWNLSGNLGFLYAREEQDDFVESYDLSHVSGNSVELGQLYCAAEASYLFDDFEPYAGLSYEYDLLHDDLRTGVSYDNEGFVANLGLRFIYGSWLGEIEGSRVLGRAGIVESALLFNLRYPF